MKGWLMAACMGLAFSQALAQGSFTYKATLDTITKDAFYEIDLPPGLVAKCRSDLADLRILGPAKRFVAYVLKNPSTTGDGEKKYAVLPGAVMVQKDSGNKHSYIDVEYPEAYLIDWMAFVIRSPVYYRRKAQVLAEGACAGEWVSLNEIVLESNTPSVKIGNVKTRRLRIDIANEDNAPLVINEVACFQSSRSLLAYLQAGSVYELLAGDAQATAPDYDLKYFTDSMHGSLKELAPGPPQWLDAREQAVLAGIQAAGQPAFQPADTADRHKAIAGRKDRSRLLLWASLLAVLLLLVYFSIKMVKAIAQKDTHDRI